MAKELKPRHDLILAGSKSGDVQVDVTSLDSIRQMYQKITNLDAIVFTAGKVHFGPLTEMTAEQFNVGLQNKLMGQINLVLEGQKHLNPSGSFTLTSGVLNYDPILLASNAAAVNGAIDGFVKSAALELPNRLRINTVSPTVLTESLDTYAPYFRGFKSVAASEVALAYAKSIEGAQTGQVYKVGFL